MGGGGGGGGGGGLKEGVMCEKGGRGSMEDVRGGWNGDCSSVHY